MTWRITKVFDLDFQEGAPVRNGTDAELPLSPLPTSRIYDAACDLPFRFQLFDDDGHLYYEGQSATCDDEAAFEPLDWAMNDSGCTYIEYRQPDGTWEML